MDTVQIYMYTEYKEVGNRPALAACRWAHRPTRAGMMGVLFRHAVQGADLVARGVAQVGQVELAGGTLAEPGGSSQVVPPLATPAA